MPKLIAFALLGLLFGTTRAAGQCVYDVSTGFDNAAGAVVAVGANDDQYTVDGGGGPVPAITGGPGVFPIPPWVANTATSLWVSSDASSNDPPGVYTYAITFDLPAAGDIADYALIGRWTSDDTGLDISVNGTSLAVTSGGFDNYTTIPPGAGKGLFVAGSNTVQFLVQNGGADTNPTGVRVDACVGLLPPEDREIDISTGFDEANLVTLADGSLDPGWLVTGPAGSGIGPGPATVINHQTFPVPPWLPATVQSKWVGLPGVDTSGPGGAYVYQTTINIPDRFDAEVSELKGKFAADDSVTNILVNGQPTGVTGAGFGAYITIPAGAGKGLFKQGDNTIEVQVENGGANPTGLRMDAEVTAGKAPPPAAECIYRISTGWDNGLEAILDPLGDPDDEYTVDNGLGAGPQPALTFPGTAFPVPPWIANNETSVWISSTPDTNDGPGTYTYEITFDLADTLDFTKLAVIGRWSTDNGGQDVIINDTPTGVTGGGFDTWTVFPPGLGNGLFVPGTNVVRFLVSNAGDAANPQGLRVDACVGLQTAENRDYDLSTGFDEETLVVLPNGATDPGYTVTGPAGSGIVDKPAVVITDTGFPIPPWVASNVQSKWIGAQADSNGPAGVYAYKTSVNLDAGIDVELATITGSFSADDELLDILVNAQSAAVSGAGFGFDKLNPLPGGVGQGLFQVGANTIEFLVQNGGDGPTGFRFDGQLSVCPIPPGGLPQLEASAFSIDTGFDNETGTVIPNSEPDDNYEMIFPPGSPVCRAVATVVPDNAFPIPPWIATTPDSKWIGPAEASANGPPGNYIFRIKVTLPAGFDAANARMVGSWTSDNNATDIVVNGTSTGIAQGGNFPAFTPFPDGAGQGLFQTGENVIEFRVFNAPPGVNPAGLRVEGFVGLSQPDPAELSTGFSNEGLGVLPAGSDDDTYVVTGPAGSGIGPRPAVLPAVLGPGWLANSATSAWAGLDANTSAGPAGTYTYDADFTVLPGQSFIRLGLQGGFTGAGRVSDVVLNGTSLNLSSAGPGALADFPAGAGKGLIQPGANTLRFLVDNPAAGPTGLRVVARAEPITPVADPLDISTGFDEATGQIIGDSQPDDDYLITSAELFEEPAVTLGPGEAPIPPWIADAATSRWIGPIGAIGALPGQYRYAIEVNLTAEQAPKAFLRGSWSVDNTGDDILINGVSTGIQNLAGFTSYTPFPADAGLGMFGPGANTIEFVITNAGDVANPHGLRVDAVVAVEGAAPRVTFRRGDVDANGVLDVTDAVRSLGFQFLGEPKPECLDAADTDDNGLVDITDAINNLGFQFLGGPPPADPGPINCGPDPTPEVPELGCDVPCP